MHLVSSDFGGVFGVGLGGEIWNRRGEEGVPEGGVQSCK